MNNTRHQIISIMILLLCYAMQGAAQEKDKDKEEPRYTVKGEALVITATKTEVEKKETGKSVTIITGKELKKKGKTKVVDALMDVPGITISRNSVFGGRANVFIRGGKSGNVLVLLDGIKVNDPLGIGKAFNFAHLTTENIERIEIISGSHSTLYGAGASGGVINIITKKGKGDPKVELSFEGGSYNTFQETLSSHGGSERSHYSFSVSRLDTEGISKAAKDVNGEWSEFDRDGYENTNFTSRIGLKVFQDVWFNFNFRYMDSLGDYDDGAYLDDPNKKFFNKTIAAGLEYHQPLIKWSKNSLWEHSVALSSMNTTRKYRDSIDENDTEESSSIFEGGIKKIEHKTYVKLSTVDTITTGFEVEQEKGSNMSSSGSIFDGQVNNIGYFIQNHLKLFKRIFLTIGGRQDKHGILGIFNSYSAAASLIIPIVETRLKGSYGTGFRAPTLYELNVETYGNINLEPETNKSYDVGFEQSILKKRISFGAIYFHNDYNNMITFNFTDLKYNNIGEVETKGGEFTIALKPVDNFKITYVHTYLITIDKEKEKNGEDSELDRRPKHQGSLNINWLIWERWNTNVNMVFVGDRKDNDETLSQYFLWNIFTSYKINDNFNIFAKVLNLFNRQYQEIYGYQMPGRSYYGGLSVKF